MESGAIATQSVGMCQLFTQSNAGVNQNQATGEFVLAVTVALSWYSMACHIEERMVREVQYNTGVEQTTLNSFH